MKFTFKLRNAESGAGGAPASAPAPAPTPAAAPVAAPVAPVAGQDGGAGAPVQAAPAPAPDTGVPAPKTFDFSADSPDFEAKYNALSEEERASFWEAADKAPTDLPVEPQSTEEAPKEGEEKPQEPVELDGEILLTPEEIASLPPKIQEVLKQADSELSRLTELTEKNKHVLSESFQEELAGVLSDPVIASRIAEMRGGAEDISYLTKAFDPSLIIKNLEAEGKVNLSEIDFSIDPESSSKQLNAIASAMFESAMRVAQVKAQYVLKEEREKVRQVGVLEKQFSDLAGSVAALKSDKPIDSPDHPINGYRSWLIEQMQSKAISFDFVEKMGPKLYATYAAEKEGGIGGLVQKATVNARKKILAGIASTAKTAATTIPTTPAPASDSMFKHGIDGKRYLSDMNYRESVYDMAIHRARETRDETLMNALDELERKQSW